MEIKLLNVASIKNNGKLAPESNKQLVFSFWQEMLHTAKSCQMPVTNSQQHKLMI